MKTLTSPYDCIGLGWKSYIAKCLGLPYETYKVEQAFLLENLSSLGVKDNIDFLVEQGVLTCNSYVNGGVYNTRVYDRLKDIRDYIGDFKTSTGYLIDYDTVFQTPYAKGLFGNPYETLLVSLIMAINLVDPDAEVQLVGTYLSNAIKSLTWLHLSSLLAYVDVYYDIEDSTLDELGSNLFIANSMMKGAYSDKLFKSEEKRILMHQLGIRVGSFVFLYKRKRRRSNNDQSIIESCRIAKITKISEREVSMISYNIIKPYEEHWFDYQNLGEQAASLYGSFNEYAPYKPIETHEAINWANLGIDWMINNDQMFSERYFITTLDSLYKVNLISLKDDGNFYNLRMDSPSAVLYLLLEYGVSVPKSSFKKKYSYVNYDYISLRVKEVLKILKPRLGYDFTKL